MRCNWNRRNNMYNDMYMHEHNSLGLLSELQIFPVGLFVAEVGSKSKNMIIGQHTMYAMKRRLSSPFKLIA